MDIYKRLIVAYTAICIVVMAEAIILGYIILQLPWIYVLLAFLGIMFSVTVGMGIYIMRGKKRKKA